MRDPLERRRYIRLTSVFPVTFQPLLPGKSPGKLYQGFTRNVSLEGLCLEISDLDNELRELLLNPDIRLGLKIDMPLSKKKIEATAKIAWIHAQEKTHPVHYFIGIYYEEIEPKIKKRIFAYAKRVRNLPRYAAAIIILLAALALFSLSYNVKVRHENRLLVEKTVELAKRYSQLERNVFLAKGKEEKLKNDMRKGFDREEELKGKIFALQKTIEETKQIQAQGLDELLAQQEQLKQALSKVQSEKAVLDQELTQVLENKGRLTADLIALKEEKQGLKQEALENMYYWLKVHQTPHTGLLTSFEGDRALKNWAFTYDQALAAQVFILFGDYPKAKKIFDFYKHQAKKIDGGFVNAFEVTKGGVAEYTVHSGPNIWLGIAILQYTNKTQDMQYMGLAKSIADWVISIQKKDKEFGICGGPRETWFSTEHNLDAYALFSMLHRLTNEKRYQVASQRSLSWLMKYARNDSAPPVNRGKGDATIATDTFSWAICALGPQALAQNDMDPEQIIQYAEENCAVEVEYYRPEGQMVKVSGFDFSKFTHLPRGGVVSTEWTAQMIVAYQVMADYFSQQEASDKSASYQQKANFYLNELSKMLISSPSKTGQGEGCLPYASDTFVDTGHGWRTPKGRRTGSVAGTAYTIFASLGYNPLSLQ